MNYPVISFVPDIGAIRERERSVSVLVKLNKTATPYTDTEVIMKEH